jgi:hypothetical protein
MLWSAAGGVRQIGLPIASDDRFRGEESREEPGVKKMKMVNLRFDDRRSARLVLPHHFDDIERIPSTLAYQHLPVVVVVGSVFGLTRMQTRACSGVFSRVLFPMVAQARGAIVSPALQGGVAHLLGQAVLQRGQSGVPLVGLALDSDAYYPGKPTDDPELVDLEPNHTDFVLAPGSDRRTLPTWRTYLASALASATDGGKERPSVTLVIGGTSESTWDEIAASVARKRPVLALLGLGDVANQIGRMVRERSLPDTHPMLVPSLRSGLLSAIPIEETQVLEEALRGMLLA